MDSLTRKKIVAFFVIILVAILILGAVVYYYFFAPRAPSGTAQPSRGIIGYFFGGSQTPPTPPTPAPQPAPVAPPITSGTVGTSSVPRLLQLTTFPVVSPSFNKQEDRILFYKKEGGALVSTELDRIAQETVSALTVIGILEAPRSRGERDRSAIFYLDQESVKSFLHIGTSSIALLPENITSFSWSPDGKSLAYTIRQNGGERVVLADRFGKNQKALADIPLFDASISWITPTTLILTTAPSGFGEGFAFSLPSNGESLHALIGPRFGLQANWSPDGTRGLVSSTRRGGGALTLSWFDIKKEQAHLLPIVTIAEKCAWMSVKKVYCAVPRDTYPAAVWPDDYLRGTLHTSDQIVAVNLDDGTTENILNQGAFDVANMIVSAKDDYLAFVNRTDGMLWRIKLK